MARLLDAALDGLTRRDTATAVLVAVAVPVVHGVLGLGGDAGFAGSLATTVALVVAIAGRGRRRAAARAGARRTTRRRRRVGAAPRAARRLRGAGAMLAMLAGLGVAAAPAAHADLRTYRVAADRVPIAGPGGGGRTARLRSRVSFPADWRRAGDAAQGLTIVERTRSCRYRVAVRLRVVTAAAPDAAALVLAERPAAPPRGLLDAGVRGTAAWRVVKRPGAGRIRLAATWARTTVHTRPAGLPPDLHAYEQIVVSATAFAGDRCATGNYRDVVGPEIGDALATARVTSFIDGAVSRS